nr:G-type lectin S-receptor-like serine/threonine-protein kinase B120 [Tanacetum cinerariifolium]
MHILLKSYPIQHVIQATHNFSEAHCVGEGACGKVYDCMIEGVHVAVKRSTSPTRGQIVAFENEITYLSQMDHVNVIKLLGCSVSSDDYILIYEYMSNSLSTLLSGMYYCGHLDPTFFSNGRLSSKVDVYSFGVIILEMLTEMKVVDEDYLHIAKAVWEKFEGGESMALADESLLNMVGQDEFQRMLTIGLLCVQEIVNKRPSSEVLVLMLENSSMELPKPSMP